MLCGSMAHTHGRGWESSDTKAFGRDLKTGQELSVCHTKVLKIVHLQCSLPSESSLG